MYYSCCKYVKIIGSIISNTVSTSSFVRLCSKEYLRLPLPRLKQIMTFSEYYYQELKRFRFDIGFNSILLLFCFVWSLEITFFFKRNRNIFMFRNYIREIRYNIYYFSWLWYLWITYYLAIPLKVLFFLGENILVKEIWFFFLQKYSCKYQKKVKFRNPSKFI